MLTRHYAANLATLLGGREESWIEVSHFDVPLHIRFHHHAAHTLYWLLSALPQPIRTFLGLIPGLKKVVRWSNAPNYGCSRDHVVWVMRKPSA